MQDEMIVDLYWKRDESAISETERKYGRYLSKIAYNILSDWEDSKETVNDTYLKAWNSMPTHMVLAFQEGGDRIGGEGLAHIFNDKFHHADKKSLLVDAVTLHNIAGDHGVIDTVNDLIHGTLCAHPSSRARQPSGSR